MNPNNLNGDQMKQQSQMINNMSDEQLKAAADQAKAYNPMMANMDPAMMRQASQMMQNMSPEQMANMQKMAAGMMGNGGMPGTGGAPQMTASKPQFTPTPTQTKPSAPATLPADQKEDLERSEELKLEANALFKDKSYEQASQKYFSAINQIRLNLDLARTKQGKDAEMACRANLAMCKLNQKDYDQVIDQCERVLEHDPSNVKCNHRMSQAAFALSDGKSVSQLKLAFKYAKIASQQQPNNPTVLGHYEQVKAKYEEVVPADQQLRAERKIPKDGVDPEEEKKGESAPKTPPVQLQGQTPTMQAPGAGMDASKIKQSVDQMSNMDDTQMDSMINMMKSNPAMMKANYERQMGQKMSDEQFNNMMNMMNPSMLKQATSMMKQNPDLIKQAQSQMGMGGGMPQAAPQMQAQQPASSAARKSGTGTEDNPVVEEIEDMGFSSSSNHQEPTQQAAAPMPGMGGMPGMNGMPGMAGMQGMPGMGNMAEMMNNPDMMKMAQDMMKNPDMMKMAQGMMGGGAAGGAGGDPAGMAKMMENPSLSGLLDNPEFLKNAVGMLKSPMARPQVEQMAKQMNLSPDTMIKMLDWLVPAAIYGNKVRKVVMHPVILYGLLILAISYVLFWLGFTNDLLFMRPFQ